MKINEAVLATEKENIRTFLAEYDLKYDDDIDYTAYIAEDDKIIATASISGDIIKAVAIAPDYRGRNLAGRLISHVIGVLNQKNINHYKLYTKPENKAVFTNLSFCEIVSTEKVTLMESKNKRIRDVLLNIKKEYRLPDVPAAALVMNCNPFTKGHRYLIETAAQRHPAVLVFVVTEDRSYFPFADRFRLVRAGTADLINVYVLPSSEYLVSKLTFPTYFLKKEYPQTEEEARLDALIFKKYFIDVFRIEKRYLGSETDSVTLKYNHELQAVLGDLVTIVPRLLIDGKPVSASTVRALYQKKEFVQIAKLVPAPTLVYLKKRCKS